MIAERDLGGDKGFEIVLVIVGSAAAPLGVSGRSRIPRRARCGFRRFLGKDVVEAGIEGLLDLGAAAKIVVQPFLLGWLEAVAGRLVARAVAISGFVGRISPFWRRLASDRRLAAVTGPLQQRIPLQFLLDERRQVEIG